MGIIDDILKGLPENARLRAFIEEQTLEIASLKSENTDLKSKLDRLDPKGFIKSEGLLWMKSESGFEQNSYCPECKSHPVMKKDAWMAGVN